MNQINWKVRVKNPHFWITLIPLLLLLAQLVAAWFNYEIDVDFLSDQALLFINLIFLILTVLGFVEDHTTDGISDSQQALKYDKPREDGKPW